MTNKTYRIYRLENNLNNDTVFMFYLPEEGVDKKSAIKGKVKRLKELHDLKKKGYVIVADILTDKEGYLNARLNVAVEDYCYLDKRETEVRLYKYKYSDAVLCKTLECIMDSKQVAMKKIVRLVRRLNGEDLCVHNEIALALYDSYLRAIL